MITNIAALIMALGAIETGFVDTAIGASGEVSRYQLMVDVWKAHNVCVKEATNPVVSTAVATLELSNRIAKFGMQTGNMPDVRQVYLLWNSPVYAYVDWEKVPDKIKDRADRYSNMVEHFMKVLKG